MTGTLDTTREAVLDAARDGFAADGVRATTMDAIADLAGVGVATVYRRFPRKALLVEAVALRESLAAITAVEDRIARAVTLPDKLVAGFAASAHEVAGRPLLRAVVDGDPELVEVLAASGSWQPLLHVVRTSIESVLDAHRDQLRPGVDPRVLAEVFARLVVSLAMLPGGAIPADDEDAIGQFATTYLLPLLGEYPT